MKIVMDEQQYQELKHQIGIFDGMFFDEEEVQCFYFLKEIVDNEYDINNMETERKKQMRRQLMEAFEWLESLNVKIKFKEKFLIYF